MLELSKNELAFTFSDSAPLFTTITFRNTSPSSSLSFKVKTTTPELFDVNPSKAFLLPGQTKAVEFRTHNRLTTEQAQQILQREKFLVQYFALAEHKTPREVEQIWQQNKNSSSLFHNIKLPLRISGINTMDMTVPRAGTPNRLDQAAANLFMSTQTNRYDNPGVRTPPQSFTNGGDMLGAKLEELNREEERLIAERDGVFAKTSRGPSKSKLKVRLLRFVALLIFCGIGFAIHKYVDFRKHLPRILAKTQYTTVTQQERVVRAGDKNGNNYHQKVLVVDTKPTTDYSGEHIVIEKPSKDAIQQQIAARQQEHREKEHQKYLEQQRKLEDQRRELEKQEAYYAEQQRLKEEQFKRQEAQYQRKVQEQYQRRQAEYQRQQEEAQRQHDELLKKQQQQSQRQQQYQGQQQYQRQQYQRQQQYQKQQEYQRQKQAQYQQQQNQQYQQQQQYHQQQAQAQYKTGAPVGVGQAPPTKVIVTAPEDAEVVINRVNDEPVRLTIIGAQDYIEGYKVDY